MKLLNVFLTMESATLFKLSGIKPGLRGAVNRHCAVKYREKHRIHAPREAFGHVPQKPIQYALPEHLFSEKLVRWVKWLQIVGILPHRTVSHLCRSLSRKDPLKNPLYSCHYYLMQHVLKLNLNKTEFVRIDPTKRNRQVTLSRSCLPTIEWLKYLGSILLNNDEP